VSCWLNLVIRICGGVASEYIVVDARPPAGAGTWYSSFSQSVSHSGVGVCLPSGAPWIRSEEMIVKEQ
jgi:hypothetical protein